MATTVLYVPEYFDIGTVNTILKDRNIQHLHPDELADLWGYISNVKDGTPDTDITGKEYEVFESLCDKVSTEDTRYNIYGNRSLSPQRIAINVKKRKSSRKIKSRTKSRIAPSKDFRGADININRIEKNKDASLPEYEVTVRGESLYITLFDTEVTITEDYISGEDNFGDTYKIPNSEILGELECDVNLDEYHSKSENNGMTKISYIINNDKT